MPRTPLFRTNTVPYHLYGRANNREWFYLPQSEVWAIFCRFLTETVDTFGFRIDAFVLMPNHYHLLGWTTERPVDEVMAWLLKRVSDEVNRRAGRINHVFGGPYKWTVIEAPFQYGHVYRYVAQNPLVVALTRRVEEYPFSSFHRRSTLPLVAHRFQQALAGLAARENFEDIPSWLNSLYDQEHREGLRRALYRRRFRFCPERVSKKLPPLFEASRT